MISQMGGLTPEIAVHPEADVIQIVDIAGPNPTTADLA